MRLLFYLLIFFINLFSLLPFFIVYGISDIIYLIFYYVIRYRRSVVKQNLEKAFPEKDAAELKRITKAFYRHLCDILLEGIKGFTISEKSLLKRYKAINPEILDKYFEEGKDIVSAGAHYANWEWGISVASIHLKHKFVAFYTPLTNPYLNRYIENSRNKFGAEMVSLKGLKKAFTIERDIPASFFFGADQNPSNPKSSHWMTFLNQDTPCMMGLELFARRYKMPVIYFDVQRVKRGYYSAELFVLEAKPEDTKTGEITEKYMRFLEQIIIRKPEHYLWSHRRWKHKRTKN